TVRRLAPAGQPQQHSRRADERRLDGAHYETGTNRATEGCPMRLARVLSVTLVAGAVTVLCVAGVTNAAKSTKAAGSPIVIGATIDLTKGMAPFDAPALTAAQIEIKKINAAGGVDGHPLVLKYLNTQLDPQATKQDATKLISQGAQIGWVTCDVDYSTPSIQ